MSVIATFNRFPVSVCTQVGDISTEETLLKFDIITQENNLVKFVPYVDPKEIYLEQHNSSIGKTWAEHNESFSSVIKKYEHENIVEIGGGSGNIFSKFDNFKTWKVVDLNPTEIYDHVNVKKIRQPYDSKYIESGDVVISSHVVEHMFYIENFFHDLQKRSPKFHIFSIPNMKQYAMSKYSATIMQEHPTYLPESVMDVLLKRTGWDILEKVYFKNHSIFYVTTPSNILSDEVIPDESRDIIELISYLQGRVDSVKHEKFYVFGAHLTYYYILNMGISEEQIIAVVDNDWKKCGRRMYGYNTRTIHSSELTPGSKVFLEMGPYNDEIRENLTDMVFI